MVEEERERIKANRGVAFKKNIDERNPDRNGFLSGPKQHRNSDRGRETKKGREKIGYGKIKTVEKGGSRHQLEKGRPSEGHIGVEGFGKGCPNHEDENKAVDGGRLDKGGVLPQESRETIPHQLTDTKGEENGKEEVHEDSEDRGGYSFISVDQEEKVKRGDKNSKEVSEGSTHHSDGDIPSALRG